MKNFEANLFYNTRGGSTQVNVNQSPEEIKMIHPPHCSTEILFFFNYSHPKLKRTTFSQRFQSTKIVSFSQKFHLFKHC